MKNTVLIVEDDKATCMLWARHLEHWGWHVLSVPSAEEATAALRIYNPLAVVLDVMLADEESGWDLLEKLRSNSKTEKLPVFVVSAVDEPRRAYREGATAFMLKPCSPFALVSKLTEELVLVDSDQSGWQ